MIMMTKRPNNSKILLWKKSICNHQTASPKQGRWRLGGVRGWGAVAPANVGVQLQSSDSLNESFFMFAFQNVNFLLFNSAVMGTVVADMSQCSKIGRD